jgi:hypothetical protein
MEYEGNKMSQELKSRLKEAKILDKKMKKEHTLMQEEEGISEREGGFWDAQQEDIFHILGLKHKSYFAGKLNGNSCQKQMEKVKEWCEKMAKLEIFDPNQS